MKVEVEKATPNRTKNQTKLSEEGCRRAWEKATPNRIKNLTKNQSKFEGGCKSAC